MTTRHCPTGKRPLSHYHAQKEGIQFFDKCADCSWYHQKPHAQTSPAYAKPAEDGNEISVTAGKVRPMDKILIGGVPRLVLGYGEELRPNEPEPVVILTLEEIGEIKLPFSTKVVLSTNKPQAEVDTSSQQAESLASRRNDEQLLAAVSQAVKQRQREDGAPDDFGLMAFDWMEGAIRMLKSGEWAEQRPLNPMLQDLEVQISEMVGSSNRYTEVQHKFAAAVRTLESLGYSYEVEGAEQWRPPAGPAPEWATRDPQEIIREMRVAILVKLADSGINLSMNQANDVADLFAADNYERGVYKA